MAINTSSTKNAITPLLLLIVPILGLLLYFGSLDDEFIGEGKQFTTLNLQVTDPGDWSSVYMLPTPAQGGSRFVYRPVMALFLRLQYRAWGDSPSSYHAVTMLLFVGILALFVLLSGRLVAHPGARVAAVLTLALHPLFSHSVENVAAQGGLLALLAMLGACYTLLLTRQGTLSRGWSVVIVSALALIAIGAHEMGLLLPVWLAAVALWAPAAPAVPAPARPGKKKTAAADEPAAPSPFGRMLTYALPILAVSILYLVLRHHAFNRLLPDPIGTLGSSRRMGASVFSGLLYRVFWPIHPTLFYPPTEANHFLPSMAVGWAVLGISLLALLGAALLRWRLGTLALALMLTPLLVLTHWIPLTSLISEQPLAFALPGFALLVGAIAGRLIGPSWSLPPTHWRGRAVFVLLGLAWAAMAWQVWARGQEWSKPETLWLAESKRHPLSASPLIELTDFYVRQENPEAARTAARAARRIAYGGDLDRLIELEADMAVTVKDDTRLKELIDEAMTRPASRPEHLEHMANYARQRDFRTESTDLLRRQSKLFPKSFETAYQLAQIELDNKNFSEAGRLASVAISNAVGKSLKAKAYERYGVVMAETGGYLFQNNQGQQAQQFLKSAEGALDQALTLDKTLYLPYIYMTRIYMGRNELERARITIVSCFNNVGAGVSSYIDLAQLYTQVLEMQGHARDAAQWMASQMDQFPGDVPLQVWGARFLIELGQYDRANQAYQSVYKLPAAQGSQADILIGWGLIALRADHQIDMAAKYWNKALELDPLNAEAKGLLASLSNPPAKDQKTAKPAPAGPAQRGGGTQPAAGPTPGGMVAPSPKAAAAATPGSVAVPTPKPTGAPTPGAVIMPSPQPTARPTPQAPAPAPTNAPAPISGIPLGGPLLATPAPAPTTTSGPNR